MENMGVDLSFYKNKKVLVTGHTGFKGTWLCKILNNFGAVVIGYSLNPSTEPNLFKLTGIEKNIISIIGDIRDFNKLKDVFETYEPEIIFHLAAQPIVIESYKNPLYTYETNVMGTVNILECIRTSSCVKSFLNITTDKVYKNNEWEWGYRENEPLEGYDPYSNSKSCSELVTNSYKNSFLKNKNIAISTARAGNVIGGGDFSKDRIIPDCIRAVEKRENIIIRNPYSTRPYQHVLESVYAYLMIAEKQYMKIEYSGAYNIGPDECDCITTGELVNLFCSKYGKNIKWESKYVEGPHEANYLKLDCSKIKNTFKWKPRWNIEKAVEKTIQWVNVYHNNENINKCMDEQIYEFLNSYQ